jgi:trk system potassium uptake protein TrkA
MFVIIAGGGRTGTELALMLLEQNHEVRVVENRPSVLTRIHREVPTEVIYEGSPINVTALEEAGIHRAQVVAACTASDEDNLIICYLARQLYQVSRTIGRVNDPRKGWLFDPEIFNVDVSLNEPEIMARLIEEEMSLGDMMTLLKLRRGDYSLVEEKLVEGSGATGIPLRDLALPGNCVIAAIIRHGKIVVPNGDTAFEPGDEVLAVTDRKGAEQLLELFNKKQK